MDEDVEKLVANAVDLADKAYRIAVQEFEMSTDKNNNLSGDSQHRFKEMCGLYLSLMSEIRFTKERDNYQEPDEEDHDDEATEDEPVVE